MSDEILRGGMVGAGAWSAVQLKAWQGVRGARIVAIADRHADRLHPIADRFSVEARYASTVEMMESADLDFLDICVRPYSHSALVDEAARRGVPVLCQKPFCESLEEARVVVEKCEAADIRLMVNENFRWQGWYRQVAEVLKEGLIGKPFYARIHERFRLTLPKFVSTQGYFAQMPRLAVFEMGTHYLDVLRFLFGMPANIYARLHHVSPHVIGEDVEIITMAYPELTAQIYHSWASVQVPGWDVTRGEDPATWAPMRMEVDGTQGTLYLRADGHLELCGDREPQLWEFPESTLPDSHIATQQHFVDCLRDGTEFETTGRDYLETVALVFAAYESDQSGKVISDII